MSSKSLFSEFFFPFIIFKLFFFHFLFHDVTSLNNPRKILSILTRKLSELNFSLICVYSNLRSWYTVGK
jgi:hypothetical protein